MEEWLANYGFQTIAAFPQFFLLPGKGKMPALLLAKVVDNILIAGNIPEIQKFSSAISKRFHIGRAINTRNLIFDSLSIKMDVSPNVSLNGRIC